MTYHGVPKKRLISIRVSAGTAQKLSDMAAAWDTTKTEVIAIALDRIYTQTLIERPGPVVKQD